MKPYEGNVFDPTQYRPMDAERLATHMEVVLGNTEVAELRTKMFELIKFSLLSGKGATAVPSISDYYIQKEGSTRDNRSFDEGGDKVRPTLRIMGDLSRFMQDELIMKYIRLHLPYVIPNESEPTR